FADFGDWGVRIVARDDGVAYRIETKMGGKIKVVGETAALSMPDVNARSWANFTDRFGCEETVPEALAAKDIRTDDDKKKMMYLPFAYSTEGKAVLITESDVFDYPVWNLKRSKKDGVSFDALFAPWPEKTVHVSNVGGWKVFKDHEKGGRWVRVRGHKDYLVETDGTRTYPWRTFVLADAAEVSKFCEADIVWALARPQAKEHDFSWIKPGKVAWDWWNAFDNIGDPEGCTTKTYERFIDFAAKTGVEYVIFDEGWSASLNIWKYSPVVDVPHLIRYAEKKGVGIILWMAWAQAVGEEARVVEYFSKLGAKGFKVDFMDRGDAECERFLWKFAEECRKAKMLVDYHGVHRPTGLSRAYPNVINYEGVHGLEQTKWYEGAYDFMANDVRQFYLRMTAGQMDYTPGAMNNYHIGRYTGTNVHPGSMGTRCRQMALMAMYEAPLQMLCDSPTNYEKNMECFRFMAATPVVWTKTVGLGGCPDTYAAIARKAKDGAWYAAAITDAQARGIEFDTAAFLEEGEWMAEIFRDAPDADFEPTHYVHETKTVKRGEKILFNTAPGGGFVVKFTKK
ncbi:MAG: glycoside hydrolase family 97 catalytic domain-containing protein, partial [Kiritimatiellae bacterium]|nr:glycoside hydrolase family 97 catalytic domain-containing protein [Kiritimatiellia bacterium]